VNNKCYLVLSAGEWNDNAVSNMQISAELSKKNSVLYVETPGRRFPKLSEYKRAIARLIRIFKREISSSKGLDPENTIIFSPLAIPSHSNILFRFVNSFILTIQIKNFLRKHGFSNIIIWTFSPYWLPVIKNLERDKLVFHCVDGLHTYDNTDSFQNSFKELSTTSDIVFTPNSILFEELKSLNDNTFKIGHGVTDSNIIGSHHYKEPPRELLNNKSKIIVYSGTLANWVDYDLLFKCAEELPDFKILLIGYIHALAPKRLVNRLIQHQRVIAVGYKDYKELPHYYQNSSIGIIPYQSNNEHIKYSTPTKFLDYFASGLPVVTTDYPAAHEMKDLADIAIDNEDFINKIRFTNLDSNKAKHYSQRRIEFAKNNTWDLQVKKMLKEL